MYGEFLLSDSSCRIWVELQADFRKSFTFRKSFILQMMLSQMPQNSKSIWYEIVMAASYFIYLQLYYFFVEMCFIFFCLLQASTGKLK